MVEQLTAAPLMHLVLTMARITVDHLRYCLSCVNDALELPQQFHAGPEGFVVGALRLVNQNGYYHLFRIVNNAGAGDDLSGPCNAPQMKLFLAGLQNGHYLSRGQSGKAVNRNVAFCAS